MIVKSPTTPTVDRTQIKQTNITEQDEFAKEVRNLDNESIIASICTGYVPLNIIKSLVNEKLPVEQQTRINAFKKLVKIGLRHNIPSVLRSHLEGFGIPKDTTIDKVIPMHATWYKSEINNFEEEERKIKISLKEDSDVIDMMQYLGIKTSDIETPVVNPHEFMPGGLIPSQILERLSKLGLFKLKISKELGGLGFSPLEYGEMIRVVSRSSESLAIVTSVQNTLGSSLLDKYYPEIAEGKSLIAFALTEVQSGTDAISGMNTEARASADNEHYELHGGKLFITGAPWAGVVFVATNIIVDKKKKSTFFTLKLPFEIKDTQEDRERKIKQLASEGLVVSNPLKLSTVPGSGQVQMTFNGYKVTKDQIRGKIGQGASDMFKALSDGRGGFAPICSERINRSCEVLEERIKERKMFRRFGGGMKDLPYVKSLFAQMKSQQAALNVISHMTMALINKVGTGGKAIAEAAAAKVTASESYVTVSRTARELWGGMGFMNGHINETELDMRNAEIWVTGEGVNVALRQLLAGIGIKGGEVLLQHALHPFRSIANNLVKQKVEYKFTPDKNKLTKELGRVFSNMFSFETGGLSIKDALWLQYQAKRLAIKCLFLGLKYQEGMEVRQLEILRIGEIAKSIYFLAGIQEKLLDKTLQADEKMALEKYVTDSKKHILDTFKELKLTNKKDNADHALAESILNNS